MKFYTLIFIFFSFSAFSQKKCDQIILVNGELINGVVTEIKNNIIFYKNCTSELNSEINIDYVFLIKYLNGTKTIFHDLNNYNAPDIKGNDSNKNEKTNSIIELSFNEIKTTDYCLEIININGDKISCQIKQVYIDKLKCYDCKKNKDIVIKLRDINSVNDFWKNIVYKK